MDIITQTAATVNRKDFLFAVFKVCTTNFQMTVFEFLFSDTKVQLAVIGVEPAVKIPLFRNAHK